MKRMAYSLTCPEALSPRDTRAPASSWALQSSRGVAAASQAPQRGMVLYTVLIITLLMALVAMGLANTVLGEYRNARNSREMALARQAAEAALRDAEADITCKRWDTGLGQMRYVAFDNTPSGNANPFCINANPVCTEMGPFAGAAGYRELTAADALAANSPTINWGNTCPAGGLDNCVVNYGGKTLAPILPLQHGASGTQNMVQQPQYHIFVDRESSPAVGVAAPIFRIRARGFASSAAVFAELEQVYKPCR